MLTALVCPISTEKIDTYLSRITVFLNVVLMLAFIVTLDPVYMLIVVVDYFIRAFIQNKYSPVRFVARFIRRATKVPPKYKDLAPKLFAARLGFVFSLAVLIVFATGNTVLAVGITSFLAILSTLDSVFDFCLGCLVYTYFIFPFFNKRNE